MDFRETNLVGKSVTSDELQYIYKFDNNYGASIVRHYFSYGHEKGLFELAVMDFKTGYGRICYDTPITDDVIGFLTVEQCNDLLEKIEKL